MILRVGDLLDDCGSFGRDAFGPFRVEAIGADWVVARDEQGVAWLASDITPEHLLRFRRTPG